MSSGLAARSFAGFADGLDPVALEAVRAAGRVRRVAKGTTLFCAGRGHRGVRHPRRGRPR